MSDLGQTLEQTIPTVRYIGMEPWPFGGRSEELPAQSVVIPAEQWTKLVLAIRQAVVAGGSSA